jgi:hypothetical protein
MTSYSLTALPAHCPDKCGHRMFTFLGGITFLCPCGLIFEYE